MTQIRRYIGTVPVCSPTLFITDSANLSDLVRQPIKPPNQILFGV